MTDKAILTEVYARLKEKTDNGFEVNSFTAIIGFIEREWQKQDNRENDLEMKMLSENPSKKWYTDVRDMERHRGLEIGPDGTVMEIK